MLPPALSISLTEQQMLEWGWRIPFLISALPGAISMWGRNRIPESDAFVETAGEGETSRSRFGLLELLKEHHLGLLVGFGATATMRFAPPFWTITAVLEPTSADNLLVATSCQMVGLAVTPLAAIVTDRYAARRNHAHGHAQSLHRGAPPRYANTAPISPPADSPCKTLQQISKAKPKSSAPLRKYLPGGRPCPTVARIMPPRESLRPRLSATYLSTNPPMGRATKVVANPNLTC